MDILRIRADFTRRPLFLLAANCLQLVIVPQDRKITVIRNSIKHNANKIVEYIIIKIAVKFIALIMWAHRLDVPACCSTRACRLGVPAYLSTTRPADMHKFYWHMAIILCLHWYKLINGRGHRLYLPLVRVV